MTAEINPTELARMRDLQRRRIKSNRSQDMDSMLARSQNTSQNTTDEQSKKNILQKAKHIEKDVSRVSKGAAQIAAGNKVAGVANIARGAKGIASKVFSGDIMQLGVLWFFVLFIAIGKDTFDMLAFETLWWADWAFDLIVGGLLWTYLFVHGARKGKVVGAAAPILEIIPGSGFLPWWTISIIYVGIKKLAQKEN
jgi:hypothetical protein